MYSFAYVPTAWFILLNGQIGILWRHHYQVAHNTEHVLCWAPDGHDPRHFEQFSRTCAPGVEVNGFTCASVWQFILHLQQQSWEDKYAFERFTEQTHYWPFQSSVVCRPTYSGYCLTSCTTHNSMKLDSSGGARTCEADEDVQLEVCICQWQPTQCNFIRNN